jgi:RecB family exonuclease
MRELPSVLSTVVVPRVFSPSQLSLGIDCRLRLVLAAGGAKVGRLPTHPAAERGSVFHQLLERAGRGAIPRCGDSREAVEKELRRLLDDAATRLSSDTTTAHYAHLEDAFSTVEWHNARQRVLAIATRLLNETSPMDSSWEQKTEHEPLRYEDLGPSGRWPEVRIQAPELRLSGRMDAVEKHLSGRVVVRDYKSGHVYDRDGRLQHSIELQLRLYALAILESDPAADVELFVTRDSDEQIHLDSASAEEARDWLVGTLDGLPPGAMLTARELAAPGPHCASCPFRPACGAYLDAAPDLWLIGTPSAAMPLDTWGEVLSFRRCEDSRLVLDLLDAAGRRVKILRLDDRHALLHRVEYGAMLWFFGLASSPGRLIEGRWLHPRNFYELPADPLQRRAWSLAVFTDSFRAGALSS